MTRHTRRVCRISRPHKTADVQEPCSSLVKHGYIYESISESETRLFTLAPSEDTSAPVEVLIFHCKREDNPGYGVISYTRGEEGKNYTIDCNGSAIKVTKSCEEALRALRDFESPQNLWIDAVCINQNDAFGRTHQVANMEEVYRKSASHWDSNCRFCSKARDELESGRGMLR